MELLMPFSPNSVPLTPLNLLERAAVAYSDCPSLVYSSTSTATSYTWDQTHSRCVKAASSITSLGIKRGDVVSVLAPNVPAMYELQFSVPMAGAILNNINTRLDPRTLSVLLTHCESKLIFVDQLLLPVLHQALSFLPPDAPSPIIVLIEEEDESVADALPIYNTNGTGVNMVANYKDLVEGGDSRFDWVRPKSEWDPIALNYTSGTTNSPKGVVISHRGSYISATDMLLEWSVPKQPV